jgi:hypothetical protein
VSNALGAAKRSRIDWLVLEAAGYAGIRKTFVGKRPRTVVNLTKAGRSAFESHVASLQEIVTQAGLSLVATQEPVGEARQTAGWKAGACRTTR